MGIKQEKPAGKKTAGKKNQNRSRPRGKPHPAIRPFYLWTAAAFCPLTGLNDDVYLPVQHCGRLFRIQLCRQNPFCSRQSDHACRHGSGNRRFHDRHRRKRPGFHDSGTGKKRTGKPVLFPPGLYLRRLQSLPVHPRLPLYPADIRRPGCGRRTAGQLHPVWADSVPLHDALRPAECIQQLFCNSGKAGTKPENIRFCRMHQYCFGLPFYCRFPLGHCRRGNCHRHGTDCGRPDSAPLFFQKK